MNKSSKSFRLQLILYSALCLIIPYNTYAQDHEKDPENGRDQRELHEIQHEFKHWRIAGGIGISLLPAGNHESEPVSVLAIPTIGLDFQYWFSPKFGLGLKNEFEIVTYVLKDENSSELEREYPLISVLVGMYKLHNGPAFYIGGGIEYEKSKNFFIVKAGVEYELEIGNHWDVTPEVYYFNKDFDFGGVGLTITFGKRF
jgi:hypothetical protein